MKKISKTKTMKILGIVTVVLFVLMAFSPMVAGRPVAEKIKTYERTIKRLERYKELLEEAEKGKTTQLPIYYERWIEDLEAHKAHLERKWGAILDISI